MCSDIWAATFSYAPVRMQEMGSSIKILKNFFLDFNF